MITPSFGLTATERILPRMALDFTTATLDPRVTFTRTDNTATVTNSSGVIVAINANLPRFDYNPTTLVCNGLLIEGSAQNLLLNSLLDGTSLATQLVTTTAVAHTLSFYGTGTIVLTGTSSATVVGTGAYPTRTTLTFTPTVGVLTLTVTGTVQYAQLEVSAFATSFIPTDATTKTRNYDYATMTGANFSSWFNASEGAFQVTAKMKSLLSASNMVFAAWDGINPQNILIRHGGASSTNVNCIVTNTTNQANMIALTTLVANTNFTVAMAYKLNNFAAAGNGGAIVADTSGTIPTVTFIDIGCQGAAGNVLNGWVSKLNYWPQRIINAEVQAFSK